MNKIYFKDGGREFIEDNSDGYWVVGACFLPHVDKGFDYSQVNEWVFDVYRPLSFQDMEDLNPVRRSAEDLIGRSIVDPNIDDPASDYDYQFFNSLISDKTRVYKGGSWKDIAYWLSPGTRRFMDQDSATSTIGFRCAMIRAGSNQ